MKRLALALAFVLAFAPFAAEAKTVTGGYNSGYTGAATSSGQRSQPDLISIGGGYFDFDKDEPKTQSADVRLEYRWGYNIWGAQNDWMDFQIHPIAGMEFTTRSQLYGFGGLAADFLFWKHMVFTWSETVGLWSSGDAKPLGSFIEFRSQAELGYRFNNDMRATVQISHISNAGLTKRNPGAEIVGAYLHVPVGSLFGH